MLDTMMKVSLTLVAFDKMSRVIKDAVSTSNQEFDKLQRKVKEVSDATKEIGIGLTSAGAGMIAAGGALGLAMQKPIESFADLEDAQTRMKVAFMTDSGVDSYFEKINKQSEKLGMKLPGTTRDFTLMAARLKELGIASKTIANGGLEGSAYLRVLLGDVSPEGVADITATFSKSLGIAEKDFVKFIDQIQRAKFAFGLDPEQFAYTLKYAGPVFKQLGISGYKQSQSVLALSGALAQAGIRGEQLGTSLRRIMLDIPSLDEKLERKRLKDVNEELKSFGITLEFFQNGKFLGIENMIRQIEKLNVLNTQDKVNAIKKLFGDEAATAIAELATQGLKGYAKAQETMKKQADLQTRLNLIMGTFKNLWEAFTGTFTNTLAQFGGTLSPELKSLAVNLNNLSDNIGKFVQSHPILAKNIALTTIALSAGLIVIGTLSLAIGGVCLMISNLTSGYVTFIKYARLLTPILRANTLQLLEFLGLNTTAHNMKIAESLKNAGNPLGIDLSKFSFKTSLLADIRRIDKNLRATLIKSFKEFPANITKANEALKIWTVTSIKAIPTNFLNGLNNLKLGLLNLPNIIKSGIVAVRALSISFLSSPLFWIGAALVGIALLVYKYWKPITGFFRGVFTGLKEGLAPLQPVFHSIATALSPILAPIKTVYNWFKNLLKPVEDTGGAAEKMGIKFGKVLAGIILKVTDLIKKMFELGAKVADFLSFGMLSKTTQTQKAISKHAQIIRDHLPHSPAKMGPLKDLHKIKLIEQIAATIKPAPLVSAMNKALSFKTKPITMSNSKQGNSGGTVSIHYNPIVTLNGSTPQDKEEFLQILKQHKDEILRMVKSEKIRQERLAY
jgi:TP901 family phage tail tape measure protein